MRLFRRLFPALLGLAACDKSQKGDESSAKTLDNFAAGKTVTTNVCKGTLTDAATAARWDARINFEPAKRARLMQRYGLQEVATPAA